MVSFGWLVLAGGLEIPLPFDPFDVAQDVLQIPPPFDGLRMYFGRNGGVRWEVQPTP